MPLQFLLSQRKRKLLTHDGYIYVKFRCKENGKVQWRCIEKQTKTKCKSTAVTSSFEENGVLLSVIKHNHAANHAKIEARRVIGQLKKAAVETNKRPRDLLEAVLKTASVSAKRELPGNSSLARAALRARVKSVTPSTTDKESLQPAELVTQVVRSNENETQNVELFPSTSQKPTNLGSNENKTQNVELFPSTSQEHTNVVSSSTSQDQVRNTNESQSGSEIRSTNNDILLRKTATVIELSRDEYQVFGDYIASEFRMLKSENSRNLLRRKIQRAILDVSEIDASVGNFFQSCQPQPVVHNDQIMGTNNNEPTQSLIICKDEVSENDIKVEN